MEKNKENVILAKIDLAMFHALGIIIEYLFGMVVKQRETMSTTQQQLVSKGMQDIKHSLNLLDKPTPESKSKVYPDGKLEDLRADSGSVYLMIIRNEQSDNTAYYSNYLDAEKQARNISDRSGHQVMVCRTFSTIDGGSTKFHF